MRKTKRLIALAIAVVMMMSLFSFLGLNSSATPVNFADPELGASATSTQTWGPVGSPNQEEIRRPEALIDGRLDTVWTPYGETATPYFIIDLGQTRSITRIEIAEGTPYRTGPNPHQSNFHIYISTTETGDDWGTPINTGPYMGTNFFHDLVAATDARRVRVVFYTGADMARRSQPTIVAIRVFGIPATHVPAVITIASAPATTATAPATVGTDVTLTATVNTDATVSGPIVWSVVTGAGTTAAGADVTTAGVVTATGAGTVTVEARIAGGGATDATDATETIVVYFAAATGPVNLATPEMGASATSTQTWGPMGSPNQEESRRPGALIDGNPGTDWTPYGETATPYFIIDLGQIRSVTRIEMVEGAPRNRTGTAANQATFRIYLSTTETGDDWGTPIYTGTVMGTNFAHDLADATDARRVRVVFITGSDMGRRSQPTVNAIRVIGTYAGTRVPVITITAAPAATAAAPATVGTDVTLTVTVNEGPVILSVVPGAGTTATGVTLTGQGGDELTAVVTATGAGTVTIEARISGTDATQTIVVYFTDAVTHVPAEITIASAPATTATAPATVGTNVTLTATVNANATVSGPIVWSVVTGAGTTAAGAAVTNAGVVTATGAGTVTVEARIAGGGNSDAVQTIVVHFAAATEVTHVPVTGLPTFNLTVNNGGTLTLPTQANPDNASARAVIWEIVTNTGNVATLTGNVLTAHATNVGTITLRATVVGGGATAGTNWTETFEIVVSKPTPPTGESAFIFLGTAAVLVAIGGYAVAMKKKNSTI